MIVAQKNQRAQKISST